ncbi:MAG TPA: hypothetical protein DGG94_08025 [Micromonosporaceae bacterium]|nr:hypothetical protein [Micromonosporaceae bacterium]HCU49733.1 hypothetical protein [Micromonosporaceae bacterium]
MRGRTLVVTSVLAAFGLASAVIQFVGQLFPSSLPAPTVVTLVSIVVCLAWGLARAYPRESFRREFKQPEMTVVVEVGDIFAQTDAHLVVGFSDTFDTSVTDKVIHGSSLQGQLLGRLYRGDGMALDRDLGLALRETMPLLQEREQNKPSGKLERYPIGTVAVLDRPHQRVFAVAYSRMGNDLIARANLDDIWHSLNRLWEAIYQHAQRETVAMPLIGSGLARVDHIERESLLKMIILSFVASSRQRLVCKELRVIIWPPDLDRINMLEVNAFVRNL